ncbi:Actin-related protein 6 [Trichinella nativa]|uniref:Actin-related protein 6 n=1 Tax=Trichinella nativa TaxID=6335 RepID=A0A0V1KQQ9_9BILA|nr:Actin-related protein 6 [Trichinella nativa]
MSAYVKTAFIMDNGGYSVKAELSLSKCPKVTPNAVMKSKRERRRVFVGDEVEECGDCSSLFYSLPIQKGYLLNWEVQRKVWDHLLGPTRHNIDCKNTCLVITQPMFNFNSIREAMYEVIFEHYGFHSLYTNTAPVFSAYKYAYENHEQWGCVIVDSGYSFTHIVPVFKGKVQYQAVIRLSMGGKALTNFLKEIVSYRLLNVMEETYVMNQCKEDIKFKYGFQRNRMRGYMRERNALPEKNSDEQFLRLGVERFSVPELLFSPSDVGIQEMGLAEALAYSILQRCPETIQPYLLNNILLTGGNCLFKGIQKRLWSDLRSLVPEEFDIRVKLADDPVCNAWQGARLFTTGKMFQQSVVTKKQYDEVGVTLCNDKLHC